MAKDKKIEIRCQNLAPISNLFKEIDTSSLQCAIYANNGQGKTFLSRAFRLLENNPENLKDSIGNILTDKFISFDKTTSDFHFKISDNGVIKEDVKIQICKGIVPDIPQTKYIYHVFNQDYINLNSKANYDKDGNITEYIIGKTNIDVSEDEKSQKSIEEKNKEIENKIKPEISNTIEKKIGSIPNIKRLNEYKEYLNYDSIFLDFEKPWDDIDKTFKEYLNDYDKIKSVPEDLPNIKDVILINENIDFLETVIVKLGEKFSLSSLAVDFKKKVSEKRDFVEKGLELLNDKKNCPFCEQNLNSDALDLIDRYTKYINDEETKTKKAFEFKKQEILNYIESINNSNVSNSRSINKFNEYAEKYFSSSKNIILEDINIEKLVGLLKNLNIKIDEKLLNISLPIDCDAKLFNDLKTEIIELNRIISINNNAIKQINTKLGNLTEENKNIRKNLCKALFNEIAKKYQNDFLNIKKNISEIQTLKIIIQKKKEQNKINKRDIVIKTIKTILNLFFSDKYSLDEDTFRLTFKNRILKNGQAREKSR